MGSSDHKTVTRLEALSNLDAELMRVCHASGSKARKYGNRFGSGFMQFFQTGELTDVVVVCGGVEYKLHMLLLAFHSEFFRRAFSSEFREKSERKVVLGFEDSAGVWPDMMEYFYTEELTLTDENVLPLLAMSRELMVPKIQEFCADYAQSSLEPSNAIHYLNQAVQFNCDSFRESCVALVAEGFPNSFHKPTDGLPIEVNMVAVTHHVALHTAQFAVTYIQMHWPCFCCPCSCFASSMLIMNDIMQVMLEVLQHPNLTVQTEEQVLTFVLNYVRRHNLAPEAVRSLFENVKFVFLSNERLSTLAQVCSGGQTSSAPLAWPGVASLLPHVQHAQSLHDCMHGCWKRWQTYCSMYQSIMLHVGTRFATWIRCRGQQCARCRCVGA